jgi:pimeloyl-ACP methyl ester carboxylesterase
MSRIGLDRAHWRRMVDRRRDPWPMLLAREARTAPELAAFIATAGPLVLRSPRGDGHAVIVLPGLGGGDSSTIPLRWFLDRLGYDTAGWGLGTNRGFGVAVRSGLDDALRVARQSSGGPVSLVGWSLGGIHAVELARRHPGDVRGIVTLGSPLARLPGPPADVPVTSVYSRSDAIVPWRASLLRGAPRRENVEVRGSHLGLGHNSAVLVVVADRLAQPQHAWQRFAAPTWARRWFPSATPS